MKYFFLYLFIICGIAYGKTDSTMWEHFFRLGIVNVDSTNGGFGYYRINRTTLNTFRDLRLFTYGLNNNSFIYLRYKSSNKYLSQPKFYRYTITSFRKNSRANVNLQYQFDQGFGYFIKDYSNGLINLELGHAFDTSDYLNATRKTSYVKTGIFWDHDTNYFSSKFELEHFSQISEVIENKLSRNIYLFQLFFPLNNGIYFNINYEKEDYIGKNQTDAASITLAVEWNGVFKK